MDPMDHRNIDQEVSPFKEGVVSTVENIAVFIWEELAKLLDEGLLFEVRVCYSSLLSNQHHQQLNVRNVRCSRFRPNSRGGVS
jgi:6-pyruvoyl-tetrahydropterin synthase